MKKFYFLFILNLLPLVANAEAVEINGIYYNLTSGNTPKATVTSSPDKYSGDVVIPASVTYNEIIYSVISIGSSAFSGCSGLTSVTIPNSVTSIGKDAFRECSGLISVTIPNSVTSIGSYSFYECSSLMSVTIPNSVTSISSYAFYGCSGLTTVSISNSVTSIGSSAFSGCSGLTTVSVPNSVTSIGSSAFYGCSDLTSVTIPHSVISIDYSAFANCSGLTSVHISDLDAWCKISFSDNDSNPLFYAHHLYLNGEEVLDLVIPNSVTSIGNYSFYNCSGLTSVTIPNSVTSIGNSAFENCSGLASVQISDIAAWCNISFSNNASNPLYYAHHLYLNGEEILDLVIPSSVTSIGNYSFSGCSALSSVDIPNSVTSIGESAFSSCSSLTSVAIPNSVTSIGSSAFYNCSGLINIAIPTGVLSINNYTFSGCTSLLSVTIPEGVESIGNSAFANCSSLISAEIPNSVNYLGRNTFDNCSSLSKVVIPEGVSSLPYYTFYGCSSLVSVTIPSTLTSIGTHVFLGCWNLNKVIISDLEAWCKIKFDEAYLNGSNPLANAHHLYMNDEEVKDLTIPETITNLNKGAFYGANGLTSVTFPNSIKTIAEYAFYGCSGLTSITFPENLTIIKGNAFQGCSSLETIIIPTPVEYIYQEAFASCSKLSSVKSLAETPPFLYDNSFSNFEIPLFVPEASIDSYKAANGWKNFTNVLSLDAAKHKLTYKVDGEVYATYELYEGELITPEPAPTREGYEFSGWSTIPPTMPAEDLTITGTFTLISDYDEIKITSAGQTTWCSKYDLDFTEEEGLKVYTATGYKRSTGTIWLSRVKEVPAGEGILIMGDEGVYKIPHRSTTAYYANLMVGTVVAMTLNETDGEYTNYYLSNGKEGVGFYKVNGSVKLGANRAYLPLKKGTSGNANTRYIGLSYDDGATNIDPLSASDADESNAAYYNLQGQRVDNPGKGLYIKNGRKVILR